MVLGLTANELDYGRGYLDQPRDFEPGGNRHYHTNCGIDVGRGADSFPWSSKLLPSRTWEGSVIL